MCYHPIVTEYRHSWHTLHLSCHQSKISNQFLLRHPWPKQVVGSQARQVLHFPPTPFGKRLVHRLLADPRQLHKARQGQPLRTLPIRRPGRLDNELASRPLFLAAASGILVGAGRLIMVLASYLLSDQLVAVFLAFFVSATGRCSPSPHLHRNMPRRAIATSAFREIRDFFDFFWADLAAWRRRILGNPAVPEIA